MTDLTIHLWPAGGRWEWTVCPFDNCEDQMAFGSSPDYHQACEQARIAWEQHSHE